MLVFAVETSCDETSVCVMDNNKNIYSHIIFSQEIHKRYGGVVPELASRAHLEILQKITKEAFEESKKKMRGRIVSDETRKRMSGRIISEETKFKIGSGRRGKKATKATLEKMSIARSKQVLPRKDTKGEIILQNICKNIGIKFVKHKNFNLGFQRHQVDVFIKPNICLESDGDYWHGNPNNFQNFVEFIEFYGNL